MKVTREEFENIKKLAENDVNNALVLIRVGNLDMAANVLEALAKELRGIEIK